VAEREAMDLLAGFFRVLEEEVSRAGVQKKQIASLLGLSASSVTEMFTSGRGGNKTPPNWERVEAIVRFCWSRRDHGEFPGIAQTAAARVLKDSEERHLQDWRLRHAMLVRDLEHARERPAGTSVNAMLQPVPEAWFPLPPDTPVFTDTGEELDQITGTPAGISALPGRPEDAVRFDLGTQEDPRRYWGPRARGVSNGAERGWRFRGRTAALRRIVDWLERPVPDRRVLVVTGSPGAGKSSVLGRVVTTADAASRALLPPGDTSVRAAVGSVGCAVLAKGKTALDVAEEIAYATCAAIPVEPEGLASAIRAALSSRGGGRFSVVIDALDEAASPEQARKMIDSVVLPLAQSCSDAGVRVLVATRPRDDRGDILGRFGPALDLLDLDDPEYFKEEDLAAYSLACLQLAGDERPGNPYADEGAAVPLAARIAETAKGNFLIAGLIARTHGLYDESAADPARLATIASVRSALEDYVERVSPVGGVPAGQLLTALAFAEAPGLPATLWQLAVKALYRVDIAAEDLALFARSSAANFLLETPGPAAAGPGDTATASAYQLFHQALSDTLIAGRGDFASLVADQRALTRGFAELGRAVSWQGVPDYLLRALPGHAHAGGLTDSLLTDDAYLLHADLRRLLQVAGAASSPSARRRARLLRLTPQAAAAAPDSRAALFSITEALNSLGATYRDSRWQAPYSAQWAVAEPRSERAYFKGHWMDVHAVCTITVDGRQLLASGASDSRACLWDPRTGEQLAVLEGHESDVNAVCAITVDHRELLASGSHDLTIRLWDPRTGEQLAVLEGHENRVLAVCAVTVGDRQLLASGSRDGTIRLWDPRTGEQLAVLEGHQDGVYALCEVTVDGRKLLASGSNGRMTGGGGGVRLWDPGGGEHLPVWEGDLGWVFSVCAVAVDGQEQLATGDSDGTVRLWDLQGSEPLARREGHQDNVNAVCAITVDHRELLASGSRDGTIRLWDPRTGEQLAVLEGHESDVNAVCAITVDHRELLASGSHDGTIRLWDPRTGEQLAVLEAHENRVLAVCAVTVGDRQLLASGDTRTVRLWDPGSGEQLAVLEGHQNGVWALCEVTVDGRQLLASGGGDSEIRLWDPGSGEQLAVLKFQPGLYAVSGMCAVTVDGRHLLASGSSDSTIRLWDPSSGEQLAVLQTDDWIRTVCAVTVESRELVASGDEDGTVQLWDPRTGICAVTVPTHHQALAVTAVSDSLAIGLNVGILVIKPNAVA